MKRLIRRILKILAFASAGLVVLLAIAVGLFRLFLPRLPESWMGTKIWALNADDAIAITESYGKKQGFDVTGRVLVYDTDPESPPRDNPYVYSTNFTPYDPEA